MLTGPILIIDQQESSEQSSSCSSSSGVRGSKSGGKSGSKLVSGPSQKHAAAPTVASSAAILHRRMVFERNRNLVQSEAVLVPVADTAGAAASHSPGSVGLSSTGTGTGTGTGTQAGSGAAGGVVVDRNAVAVGSDCVVKDKGKSLPDAPAAAVAAAAAAARGGGGGKECKQAAKKGASKSLGRQARREAGKGGKAGGSTSERARAEGGIKESMKKDERGAEGRVRLEVDHSRLASEYHAGMVAGLAVMKERVVRAVEEKRVSE